MLAIHYAANEIIWNRRFVDIIHKTADGHRYVDYAHFHDVTVEVGAGG